MKLKKTIITLGLVSGLNLILILFRGSIMDWTDFIILSAVEILLVGTVFAYDMKWMTVSNKMKFFGTAHNWLPYSLGVLMGHWFGYDAPGHIIFWPAAFLPGLFIGLIENRVKWWPTKHPVFWLFLGIPAGMWFWGANGP